MSKRILGVGIILGGLIVLAIALIIGIGFPKFVYDTNLKAVCIQDASHPRYKLWVDDAFVSNINRIYYWNIDNPEDFLYKGAIPQVSQRGPYVYREIVHRKIDVRFVGTRTEFHVWRQQEFDADLTTVECGPHCAEHDQLTLVNTEYLRDVTSAGGEWQLAAVYLPSVMRSTVRHLIRVAGDIASLATLLADTDCDAVDRWRVPLDYPPGFHCLGFGGWLALNDTADKAVVLSEFAGAPPNVDEATAIYAALTGCPELFANLSCVYFDDNSTFSATPVSDFVRTLLDTRSGNVSSDNATASNIIAAALCPDSQFDSCLAASRARRSAAAYVRVLSAYVTIHLAAYAFYRAVYVPGNDVVVSRSQSRLALGDHQHGSGILEHYVDAASASNGSHLVAVYNCYDAIFAVTNGHWESYGWQGSSTSEQFPLASASARLISGSLRHELPPMTQLRACASYQLSSGAVYRVFLPDFWRAVDYYVDSTTDIHHGGTSLSRLVFNSSNMEADGQFVFEDGLQEMSSTTGFTSWLSLPHFLYASTTIQRRFLATPSDSLHLSFRDFEPVTGSMWRDVTRYQLNVAIDKEVTGQIQRPRQLSMAYVDQPLPVYWVEKSSTINSAGVEDFYSRVGNYMSSSCGGLVGLTILATIIVAIGMLAATVTIRDGRVAPIEPDNMSFF